MYADDTIIYYAASGISQLQQVLNSELSHLLEWSYNNELIIHPKKTEFVIFGTQQKLNKCNNDTCDLFLGEQKVNRVNVYKYLGVYLDQSLSFKEHTSKLISKITCQLGILRRIR